MKDAEADRHLLEPTTDVSRAGVATVVLAIVLGLSACGPAFATESTTSVGGSGTGPDPMTSTGMTTVVSTGDDDTATGSDTGDSDDGPCGDTGCPDGGPIECDPLAQDCAVGEKCMPWSNDGADRWNATRCSAIDVNPGQLGDECTVEGSPYSGRDSCDFGLICWEVDPETVLGTCIPMCTGTWANPLCDDPDQQCSISHDDAVTVCLDMCNPLMGDCGEGHGCYSPHGFEGDSFVCWATQDPGTYPTPCDTFFDCDSGSFCAAPELVPGCEGTGCCTEYCNVDMPETCPGSEQGVYCRTWWENATPPPGYEDLGACALPWAPSR